MAIDICVLKDTGGVEAYVSLGLFEHDDLMTAACALWCPLLLKILDYWGDAAYEPEELEQLYHEVDCVYPIVGPSTQRRLEMVRQIISTAKSLGRGLRALAD